MNAIRIKRTAVLAFAAALCLVLLQTITGIVPEQMLYGVDLRPHPRFSLDDVLSAKFQKEADAWMAGSIGFRNTLVRMDNQLTFSLFREVSREEGKERGKGTLLVLGRENYLYENEYIESFNRRDVIPPFDLELKVLRLKEVQRYFASRKVPVLFLITPSKATVYAEFIEQRNIVPGSAGKAGNYERVLPLLDRYGIVYLDGHAFFSRLKRTAGYPVFAKSGSHWTEQSVLAFSTELVSRMEQLLKRRLRKIRVLSEDVSHVPQVQDGDLAWLANVFTPSAFYEKEYRYPRYDGSEPERGPSFMPKITVIGGSFCYQLINTLISAKAANVLFSYYFQRLDLYTTADVRSHRAFAEPDVAEFRRRPLDLLAGSDLVIIETNEARLFDLGHGFLESAEADIASRARTAR